MIANALIYFASSNIKDPHEMEDYIAKTNIKGVGTDKTINEILESFSEEQETALYTAIGMVADNESDTIEDIELTIYEVIETFNTEQKKC